MASNEKRGLGGSARIDATRLARMELFVRNGAPSELTALELALRAHPLDHLPPLDRSYLELTEVYVWAGPAAEAGRLGDALEADVAEEIRSDVQATKPSANAARPSASRAEAITQVLPRRRP